MVRSYEDLIVWQRAIDLTTGCYRVPDRLLSTERYGLSAQLRRACTSVAANIAEGHARRNRAEFVHFLSIAHGLLVEVETHVTVLIRVGYVPIGDAAECQRLATEVSKMLSSMRRKLGDVRVHGAGR